MNEQVMEKTTENTGHRMSLDETSEASSYIRGDCLEISESFVKVKQENAEGCEIKQETTPSANVQMVQDRLDEVSSTISSSQCNERTTTNEVKNEDEENSLVQMSKRALKRLKKKEQWEQVKKEKRYLDSILCWII